LAFAGGVGGFVAVAAFGEPVVALGADAPEAGVLEGGVTTGGLAIGGAGFVGVVRGMDLEIPGGAGLAEGVVAAFAGISVPPRFVAAVAGAALVAMVLPFSTPGVPEGLLLAADALPGGAVGVVFANGGKGIGVTAGAVATLVGGGVVAGFVGIELGLAVG
jgi:hypothetical protein